MATTISKKFKTKREVKKPVREKRDTSKVVSFLCELPIKAICGIYNIGLYVLSMILSVATFAMLMYMSVMTTSLSIGLFGFNVNQVDIILIMAALVIILFTTLTAFTIFKMLVKMYFEKIAKKNKMTYIKDEITGKFKIEK